MEGEKKAFVTRQETGFFLLVQGTNQETYDKIKREGKGQETTDHASCTLASWTSSSKMGN